MEGPTEPQVLGVEWTELYQIWGGRKPTLINILDFGHFVLLERTATQRRLGSKIEPIPHFLPSCKN